MIIALAGRRIEAPGAETRRFASENIELVRWRLRELLRPLDALTITRSGEPMSAVFRPNQRGFS